MAPRLSGPGFRDIPKRQPREFNAAPLEEGVVEAKEPHEPMCGEMMANAVRESEFRDRFRIAMFVLSHFHDPLMSIAVLQDENNGRPGLLAGKKRAFTDRANLYDFYSLARRALPEIGGNEGALRMFCDYFVKVERFQYHGLSRSLSPSDKRKVMDDRRRYLNELQSGIHEMASKSIALRLELEACLDRARAEMA